jgi:hypothetical protein
VTGTAGSVKRFAFGSIASGQSAGGVQAYKSGKGRHGERGFELHYSLRKSQIEIDTACFITNPFKQRYAWRLYLALLHTWLYYISRALNLGLIGFQRKSRVGCVNAEAKRDKHRSVAGLENRHRNIKEVCYLAGPKKRARL